jgi:hypothetical protein
MSSLGVYNATYFTNNPEQKDIPGILYCVVLVNKSTFERECIKIGITKGTSTKDIIKRAAGFKGYEIRIQKTYADTLYNVWVLEQDLHKRFSSQRYLTPSNKFGGHTELFKFDPEIIKAVPSKKK